MQDIKVTKVLRNDEIQRQRKELPIMYMEQEIMEAIIQNDIVIIQGETGSGKTTQVPQFLYESGFGVKENQDRSGKIGVTQPRRISAISISRRVAYELNCQDSSLVGYKVRYDKNIQQSSCIKFMTDGILLRELQSDFLLKDYSCIILDEAHERSLNTDILLGMLTRVVKLRQDLYKRSQQENNQQNQLLKLIIMSATLNLEELLQNQNLFKMPPPVIQVEARQFPISVHFNRKTELENYVAAAFTKACKIHRQLPNGGILIFLTGRYEVELLCRKLRNEFRIQNSNKQPQIQKNLNKFQSHTQQIQQSSQQSNRKLHEIDNIDPFQSQDYGELDDQEIEADILDQEDQIQDLSEDEEEDEIQILNAQTQKQINKQKNSKVQQDINYPRNKFMISNENKQGVNKQSQSIDQQFSFRNSPDITRHIDGKYTNSQVQVKKNEDQKGLVILPLYAMLDSSQQNQIFQKVPENTRLIIVSTNVAETSITIPNIRYVVDCGRSKQISLNHQTGLRKFQIDWISKSSANQRAGRSARLGPGHVYRLYSSAHFANNFPDFSKPEIQETSLEGISLTLKAIGVQKIENFPFPTPPDRNALISTCNQLCYIGALDNQLRITQFGKLMARLPLNPRVSRFLIEAVIQSINESQDHDKMYLLHESLIVASAISIDQPFVDIDSQNQQSTISIQHRKEKHNQLTDSKQTINQRQQGFRTAQSDLFSISKILQEYMQISGNNNSTLVYSKDQHTGNTNYRSNSDIKNKAEFCQFYGLIQKSFEDAQKLHDQLRVSLLYLLGDMDNIDMLINGIQNYLNQQETRQIANQQLMFDNVAKILESLNSYQIYPIKKNHFISIANLLLTGWCDQVAQRYDLPLQMQKSKNVSKQLYQPLFKIDNDSNDLETEDSQENQNGLVQVHPRARIFYSETPSFILYTQLTQQREKVYMTNTIKIEGQQLSNLQSPLRNVISIAQNQLPHYSVKQDQVLRPYIVTYGPNQWDLPPLFLQEKSRVESCLCFAQSFLSGGLYKSTEGIISCLNFNPSHLQQSSLRYQSKIQELLLVFEENQIDCKRRLEAFILQQPLIKVKIQNLYQRKNTNNLIDLWNALIQEIQDKQDKDCKEQQLMQQKIQVRSKINLDNLQNYSVKKNDNIKSKREMQKSGFLKKKLQKQY